MKYKVGIVGAAGYVGSELARLLLAHPEFDLKFVTSDSYEGTPIGDVYPSFAGVSDLTFTESSDESLYTCDAVFLAVPHTASMGIAPKLIEQGVSVIDLSADFRLKDPQVYESWYGVKHTAPDLLARAAFGLPEVLPEEINRAAADHASGLPVLVACAGCYPTATALAAFPVLKAGIVDAQGVVVVDAISGMTGAGSKATDRTRFCSANENLEAYSVGNHRHTPEIEQILGLENRLVFTPHLAPLNRGLLSTVNMPVSSETTMPSQEQLEQVYHDFYDASPFVSVISSPQMPKTSSVTGTNRAHVGVGLNERAHMIIATCAIDNLGKGAAGQAVQCANLVFGLSEDEGLCDLSCPV